MAKIAPGPLGVKIIGGIGKGRPPRYFKQRQVAAPPPPPYPLVFSEPWSG